MSSKIAIKAENISKQYRLGEVGTGTISHDINRWWAKMRGKEDPFLKIGESNDRTSKGQSDYVWSLRDISFEIQQGEAVGIVGRNGAGKSTLLKLLSKVTKPTTGSFKVKGRIASLLEVGTGFHPEMTGRENIYLNGAILGMRKHEIKRKFDEIVDFAGIERYIDTPVKRYSSGMYVRLAFAVAAHLESEILIVDEVLAVGDSEFQKKCLGKMSDVSKGEGRTVLFVSHNMAAVQNLCTQGILLENGGLKLYGKIETCIESYLTSATIGKDKQIYEITNRSGNQEVIFKDLYIVNEQDAMIDTILTGQNIKIIIKVFAARDSKNVNIGLSLHDNLDNLLCYLYSGFQNCLFNVNKGENIITLHLNNISIYTSSLKIRGRILVNEIESDWPKETLLELSMEHGDFYNTGKTVDINSNFLIKGQWK